MANDVLLAALKSIADENGLSRIDLGYVDYGYSNGDAVASVWFALPDEECGYSSAFAEDFDTAIERALYGKAAKLAAPIAEAA